MASVSVKASNNVVGGEEVVSCVVVLPRARLIDEGSIVNKNWTNKKKKKRKAKKKAKKKTKTMPSKKIIHPLSLCPCYVRCST